MEEEGDWQLHLPTDDDISTNRAIADAKSKGIPLPANVPASALCGGTIRKLGGKKVKKIIGDDWGEDLEIPKTNTGLKLKISDERIFPDTIRQVSSATDNSPSPSKPLSAASFTARLKAAERSPSLKNDLDQYRDNEDDEDSFGDFPTIKLPKNRSPLKVSNINASPFKQAAQNLIERFDDDLELPEDGELKLPARKEPPRTPASQSVDEFDMDWADGSQASFGISHGGSRPTGRSNRSSSFSARSPSVFSPSLSSCLTAESEDEGLEGLVLPDGPIKFEEALRKRLATASPEQREPVKVDALAAPQEDFFSGIDIGQGDVFDSGKLTLNRNIKHKATRQGSPKRPAMTLTFTNKLSAPITRIPKPAGHERPRSKLDTVPESGGPLHALRRTTSRVGGHSTQSSITSIPTPTASTFSQSPGPSTPSRRGLSARKSKESMKTEPTTTGAQLLKSKRSMPLLNSRSQASPARNPPSFPRPSSRTDKHIRPGFPARPKTPADRTGTESSLGVHRKPPVPFPSASTTHASSRHITAKSSRTFHRPTSSDSNSNENAPLTSRSISRLSNPRHRPTTPTSRRDIAPASLAKVAASTSQVTQPKRRRFYGDGNELDVFDDLPTSANAEAKFVKPKAPALKQSSRGNMRSLYSHPNQSAPTFARAEPRTPLSPQKSSANQVPRFAQSTTASLARKQRNGAISPQALRHPIPQSIENSTNLSTTWKATSGMKNIAPPRSSTKRDPKTQQKPHLIKQLTNSTQRRTEKGMHYNPDLFRWEGNEHVLAPFDAPASPRHIASTPSKPALIANVGSTKGVLVNGGMVFDPQRMCWLKLAPNGNHNHNRAQSGAISITTEDEEEDPFAGFEELKDDVKTQVEVGAGGIKASREAGSDDDWTVGEEFDVGPGFVRRQTNEEAKWTRRLEGWSAVFKTEKMWEARWEIQALVQHRA